MKISYNWLKSYFESEIPSPKELESIFSNHLFEVEGLEEKNGDVIIEGKVLPDRAHYLLCHIGVAREIGVLTNSKLKDIKFPQITVCDIKPKIKINIENDKLCRRYVAREVYDIAIIDSPAWLVSNLESIGQRSINFLVDIANFVMFDVGQPMHIFDADKISGNIEIRNAKAGEKITLLTGEEISLNENNLVIADGVGPLAIAGVKGGKRAEVTESTKNILIESANFDPATVRRTSTKLNLRNDSSKRFENEITQDLAMEAMIEISALIAESISKAKFGEITDIYPKKIEKWKVTALTENIEAMLGVAVSEKQVEDIMKRMGCEVDHDGQKMIIIPPTNRLDLRIEEDIADEVGRIIGFDKIPSKLTPELSKKTPINKVFYTAEKIKNSLISSGFSETLLYSLVNSGYYEIAYPLASDKSALRENLQTKLSQSLILNGRNADLLQLETIKLFEIGNVFKMEGEETHLGIGVMQVKKKKGITSESILKEAVSELEKTFGDLSSGTYSIGEYGAIFEIDLNVIIENNNTSGDLKSLDFKALPDDKKFQKFSPYPFISRDVALFVPSEVNESEVLSVLEKEAGPLCVKKYLFDTFEKEIDGVKKKSLAFRLIFQSFEKTLIDADANIVMDRIYLVLKEKGWQIR